jgi:hypothetical protein
MTMDMRMLTKLSRVPGILHSKRIIIGVSLMSSCLQLLLNMDFYSLKVLLDSLFKTYQNQLQTMKSSVTLLENKLVLTLMIKK